MEAPAADRDRSRTAWTTVRVAGLLVLVKAGAWLLTGSAGVLGSTLDSFLDVLASLLVLWAVLAAERPADADHPWGHGKAESLAGLFQAVFILVSGLGLAFETIRRFLQGGAHVDRPAVGVVVMLFSSAVTFWWVRRLRRASRRTGSPALEADSAHYASDVLMNLAVIAGLAVSRLLGGAVWPDLLVGLGIALLILNTAREVLLQSIGGLMDQGLEPQEAAAVLRVVARHRPRVAGFHDLKTRRSGREIFLELHLDMPRELSFLEAHDLSEEVARDIERVLPHSRVTVHADPL